MIPVVSVVGFQNSGKTTVVEALVRLLGSHGLEVGTIKHAHHYSLDQEGKDSWRHQQAGAEAVVVTDGASFALLSQRARGLERLLEYFVDFELVITEGFRTAGRPKIEVSSACNLEESGRLLALEDPTVAAVAAECPAQVERLLSSAGRTLPVFDRSDHESIMRFVLQELLPPQQELVGVILAGGDSSRVGEDKAFATVNGETLIERQLRRLGLICRELIIVTNRPDAFINLGAQVVTDSTLGEGPLAGLHAGLLAASGRSCFVTGVDLPFVSLDLAVYSALVMAGVFAAEDSGEVPQLDMVVPEDEGGLQPLHAMYASSCLPILESVFARDFTPAIRELIFDGTTRFLDTELIERFGSPQTVFFNVNTPSDLKEADRILGHLE